MARKLRFENPLRETSSGLFHPSLPADPTPAELELAALYAEVAAAQRAAREVCAPSSVVDDLGVGEDPLRAVLLELRNPLEAARWEYRDEAVAAAKMALESWRVWQVHEARAGRPLRRPLPN